MITEKVGTNQTSERPINVTQKNIALYENKIREIKSVVSQKFEIESQKNSLSEQLNEEKNNELQFEKIKEAVEYNNKEELKIKPYEDMLSKKKTELKRIEEKVKTELLELVEIAREYISYNQNTKKICPTEKCVFFSKTPRF